MKELAEIAGLAAATLAAFALALLLAWLWLRGLFRALRAFSPLARARRESPRLAPKVRTELPAILKPGFQR